MDGSERKKGLMSMSGRACSSGGGAQGAMCALYFQSDRQRCNNGWHAAPRRTHGRRCTGNDACRLNTEACEGVGQGTLCSNTGSPQSEFQQNHRQAGCMGAKGPSCRFRVCSARRTRGTRYGGLVHKLKSGRMLPGCIHVVCSNLRNAPFVCRYRIEGPVRLEGNAICSQTRDAPQLRTSQTIQRTLWRLFARLPWS